MSLSFLFLVVACSCEPGSMGSTVHPPSQLVVYSGRSESLVGPLLEQAKGATGLDIQVQYGDTAELVTRLITEGAESPADLILAQDSGHLGALATRGLLTNLPETILEKVGPGFRDPGGHWVGTSGRLRVLVYNTESVPTAELPKGLFDLANEKWNGQLGWAPSNSSFQAHVSALRSLWGEEKTREWLTAVMALQPTRYPKNSPQVAAAAEGEISIGWVNHYYLYRKKAPGFTAANYSFSNERDAGNVMMVAGVGIRQGTPHPQQAQVLVEHLLSAAAQTTLATEVFEYPARPGIPTHPDVPSLDSVSLADLDQDALTDLGPTRALLRSLGLI